MKCLPSPGFDALFPFLCYAAAALFPLRVPVRTGEMGNLPFQSLILLGFCALAAFWLLFIRTPLLRAVFLILIAIFTLVAGGLQGEDIALEFLALAGFNALLVQSYGPGVNLAAAVPVLGVSTMTQREMLILGERVGGPSFGSVLFLLLGQGLLLFLLNRLYGEKREEGRLRSDLLARERAIAHLTDANRDFQDFAIHLEEESRSDERMRITRDLHDITGYTLTGAAMLLEHVQDLLSRGRAGEADALLDSVKEQIRKGHEEIRVSLRKLRSIGDYGDFYSAVLRILRNFEAATGVRVEVDFTNMSVAMGRFGQTVLFRLLQEGLTNAFRHGKAGRVSIMFFQERETLVVSLEDDGKGAETIEEGIGLKGMGERIAKLKGEVVYGSTSLGFTLRARIPLASLRRNHEGE